MTENGPQIVDLALPQTPFCEMTKLNDQQFTDLDFMNFIARDVAKEHWPRWISTILENGSRDQVYELILKD